MLINIKCINATCCGVVFSNLMEAPDSMSYQGRAELLRIFKNRKSSIKKAIIYLRPPHLEFLKLCLIQGGNLLDIGCEYGDFLSVAQRTYNVSGIDINAQAISFAKEKLHLKQVYLASLHEYYKIWQRTNSPSYDVVTLFDVFEHFDKPKETLSIVREMLKPGGWIAISVPNRDRWPNLHEESDQPPWHLTYWNKDALAQCISRNGFKPSLVKVLQDPGRILIETASIVTRPVFSRKSSKFYGRTPSGSFVLPGWLITSRDIIKYLELPLDVILQIVKAQGQGLLIVGTRV